MNRRYLGYALLCVSLAVYAYFSHFILFPKLESIEADIFYIDYFASDSEEGYHKKNEKILVQDKLLFKRLDQIIQLLNEKPFSSHRKGPYQFLCHMTLIDKHGEEINLTLRKMKNDSEMKITIKYYASFKTIGLPFDYELFRLIESEVDSFIN